MNLKIALAQIKTITGDLEGNTNRIIEAIKKAEGNCDIVVFPELAISSYNCGTLFTQMSFIEYQTKFLNDVIIPAVPKELVVIIGFIDCLGKRFDGGPEIQNSVAVIQGGRMVGKYAKILLANSGHHEDRKYFNPGGLPNVIEVEINGTKLKLGLPICEDGWNDDHRRNIVNEFVHAGAEIIISVNQSYFYYGKQEKRREMYKNHAKTHNVPVVAVNSSGVGDFGGKNIIMYDGGSMVVGANGEILEEAKRFSEDFLIVDLDDRPIRKEFHPKEYEKFEEIYDAIIFSQKELFKDLGFKKALVAVSGGLDSAVCLAIMADAMGSDNIIGISMPTKYNGDVTKTNAQQLCDSLGVKLYWESLQEVQESLINSFEKCFNHEPELINISTMDAVTRTTVGISASQFLKAGLISTSNHTELVLNWFSWHDISTAAVYGPLSDLTKVEIFKMAEFINKKWRREIVPTNLFNGETQPGPELADAAHASWDYFVVSGICAMLVRERKDIHEIVEMYKNKTLPDDFFPLNQKGQSIYQLVTDAEEFEKITRMCFTRQKASVYKLAQAAPLLMLSPHFSRGFSNRESMINYYTQDYTF